MILTVQHDSITQQRGFCSPQYLPYFVLVFLFLLFFLVAFTIVA